MFKGFTKNLECKFKEINQTDKFVFSFSDLELIKKDG